MAKKKEDSDKSSIEDAIIKEFGNIITTAEHVKNLRNKIIPITPKLDIAMGGGLQEGTFTILTGPPKVGKSSLSLQIAANAQKIDSDLVHVKYFILIVKDVLKIEIWQEIQD